MIVLSCASSECFQDYGTRSRRHRSSAAAAAVASLFYSCAAASAVVVVVACFQIGDREPLLLFTAVWWWHEHRTSAHHVPVDDRRYCSAFIQRLFFLVVFVSSRAFLSHFFFPHERTSLGCVWLLCLAAVFFVVCPYRCVCVLCAPAERRTGV